MGCLSQICADSLFLWIMMYKAPFSMIKTPTVYDHLP